MKDERLGFEFAPSKRQGHKLVDQSHQEIKELNKSVQVKLNAIESKVIKDEFIDFENEEILQGFDTASHQQYSGLDTRFYKL